MTARSTKTPRPVSRWRAHSDRDDESDQLTNSLGFHENQFNIDPFTGHLLTEGELNHEGTRTCNVTVQVTDSLNRNGDADTSSDDTGRVRINVQNVDEPPLASGSETPMIDENLDRVIARYSARDPEGDAVTGCDTNGVDAGKFEIADGQLSLIDPPDFETPENNNGQNDYEVTVIAETDTLDGEISVTVTVEDVNEAPTIMGPAGGATNENSNINTFRYTAIDPEHGQTAWTLSGSDSSKFTIDIDGMLEFIDSPDYDARADANRDNRYDATVRATDDGSPNLTRTKDVSKYVSDIDELPVISGDSNADYPENSTSRVGTFNASDPEHGQIIWSLDGMDAIQFELRGTWRGRRDLYFKSPPDFESSTSYRVTILASDGGQSSEHVVDVSSTDIDEQETLSLALDQPVQGIQLTTTFTEADVPRNQSWQWARSTSRSGGWTDIGSGKSDSYTPTLDDVGYYLRVILTYDDFHQTDRTLTAVSARSVIRNKDINTDPEFPASETGQRSIRENSPAGTRVGDAIAAQDDDNDVLRYSLSGLGVDKYNINSSGQITVKRGALIDHESDPGNPPEHSLTVTVRDYFGGSDTISVTVTIEDVNEPVVAIHDNARTPEDTETVIDVLANDEDPERATLTVSGSQSGLSKEGGTWMVDGTAIRYQPPLNYHGQDSFSYQVSDGTFRDSAIVVVVVSSLNDPPEFPDEPIELKVSQNAKEGDTVGRSVIAEDAVKEHRGRLSYSISGASEFEIDERSGQITVAANAMVDSTLTASYTVTVESRDPERVSDYVDVTINVVDQVAPPPIIGPIRVGGGAPPPMPEPSDEEFDWNLTRDIEALHRDNDLPTDIWSDGSTIWVIENSETVPDRLFAYDLAFGERSEALDLELDQRNRDPRGIWSNGTTALVLDSVRDALFAYDLESGRLLTEFCWTN
jgi:hypothetical protein